MAKGEERHGIYGQGCVCISPRVKTKRADDCRRDWTGTPHNRSSFPRSPLGKLGTKKSKLGWLRTRANTTHERRGYVDRLRNGTSLLLLTGHFSELNLMDHGVMHVVQPRPDLGGGLGGCLGVGGQCNVV